MSQVEANAGNIPARRSTSGWNQLWLKEDWWAIWLGLAIVAVGLVLFANGGSWRWVAVVPVKWTSVAQLSQHFAENWLRYAVQFALWAAAFAFSLNVMGHKARQFLPAFALLYAMSIAVFVIGQWDRANFYGFEAPLVALLFGSLIGNLVGLPRWLDAGFRVEYYIKTAIVLLGATIPFTLIIWPDRSLFSRPQSSRWSPLASSTGAPNGLASTAALPPCWAWAARCAACPRRSRFPARWGRRKRTRPSPSRWS